MSKRICVIGNFSGRNAGDAAILGGLLAEVSRRYPDATFLVPTINPEFVRRQYHEYNVEPIGLLPWHGSIKIFGIPILRSILRCDVVLVTDAILFDKKLFNPLFNYLSTLALVLPWAKRRGKSVLLYNVNLGPIYTRAGRWCLNRVLRSCDEVIIRDTVSWKELPPDIDREHVWQGADSAFNAAPADPDRVTQILQAEGISDAGRPFVTMTLNSYVNTFLPKSVDTVSKDEFIDTMARCVNGFLKKVPVMLALVITQVMDAPLAAELFSRAEEKNRIKLISTSRYPYEDLAGVFGKAEMHVGARTHSLILAAARSTPVIGILVTPKNRGFMESIRQNARMVEPANMESELLERMLDTWDRRVDIRRELQAIVAAEMGKARSSVEHLKPYMEDEADTIPITPTRYGV